MAGESTPTARTVHWQAWDVIDGHLLLHAGSLGTRRSTSSTLPLRGVQLCSGRAPFDVCRLGAGLLIVAACVVALAVTGSRGPANAARSAVAVAVLAGPLLTMQTVWLLVEEPDHTGTSVFPWRPSC